MDFGAGPRLAPLAGMRPWILLASLAVAAPALAQPSLAPLAEPAQPETVTTSYRTSTLVADGLSIAAIAASFASEGPNGRDRAVTGPLLVAGVIGGAWLTPIIHGVRGHGGRAVGSWLLREGAMGLGMIIGVSTANCMGSGDLFCGLDRLGPGLLGGLVVASVLDAAFLTDETHERAPAATWSPVIAPRQGGGTVGVAASF